MSNESVDVLFSSATNFQWSGPGKSFDEDDDEIEEEIIDDIEENCENDLEKEKSDHLYKFEKEKSGFENKAGKSEESEKSDDFWDAPRKEAGDSSAHEDFEENSKRNLRELLVFRKTLFQWTSLKWDMNMIVKRFVCVCVCMCAHVFVGTKTWKFTIFVGTNGPFGDQNLGSHKFEGNLETENVVLVTVLQLVMVRHSFSMVRG